MELSRYLRVIRNRGWLMVLLAVITAVTAVAVSKWVITPEYRSTVIMTVNPGRGADYGSGLGVKNFLWNLSEQMRLSDDIAQGVAQRLQIDLSPETLKSRIIADPDEARFLIHIQAKDSDPVIAQQLAQTWAQVFIEKRTASNQELDQSDRIIVDIVSNAKAGELYAPKTKINALAGAILGFLIGALIAFLLEYIESGILRRSDDVEASLQMPVLGTIPRLATTQSGRSSGALANIKRLARSTFLMLTTALGIILALILLVSRSLR